jgi:CRISPR/Cas system-associated endoribonuclease Cas2
LEEKMNIELDVIGIFHSHTYEITRHGERSAWVSKAQQEGGVWVDYSTFIPWAAVYAVRFK